MSALASGFKIPSGGLGWGGSEQVSGKVRFQELEWQGVLGSH